MFSDLVHTGIGSLESHEGITGSSVCLVWKSSSLVFSIRSQLHYRGRTDRVYTQRVASRPCAITARLSTPLESGTTVNLGIELSLETWTKLGSCKTTGEIWWLTAAHHTCDIYHSDYCGDIRTMLPWKDPATGAPRFDFLLKQSTTAVLDPSFLPAFDYLCRRGDFTDSSATAPINYAIRTRGWSWKLCRRLLQKIKRTRQRRPGIEEKMVARERWQREASTIYVYS
jgi:hypothetical protein